MPKSAQERTKGAKMRSKSANMRTKRAQVTPKSAHERQNVRQERPGDPREWKYAEICRNAEIDDPYSVLARFLCTPAAP